jgi:hypothetical protein
LELWIHCEISFSHILTNGVYNFSNNLMLFLCDVHFCLVRVCTRRAQEEGSNAIAPPCIAIFLLSSPLPQSSVTTTGRTHTHTFPMTCSELPDAEHCGLGAPNLFPVLSVVRSHARTCCVCHSSSNSKLGARYSCNVGQFVQTIMQSYLLIYCCMVTCQPWDQMFNIRYSVNS